MQKNHLLQKAISLYLADVLDFKSKNAQYEVLEKTKTAQTTKFQLKMALFYDGLTPYARNNDENDVFNGKLNRLNVEVLLPLNE
ncbi:hypothetical protein KXD40_000753 [Peronospora effusa]|uniref:Uncharacterized protein n=1 Tax=Peronospora effusa TaxID=542832 RepID=A0A3M6VVC8_9STRA|nr:hypothetical protein DD238_001051 [Peronospora effusa]RQM17869.1 hypothetical protein DD237_002230 [Peronospora effusa]UIZ21148.1 hypothetical protein KXD40_000753 [Peronospora effusa]